MSKTPHLLGNVWCMWCHSRKTDNYVKLMEFYSIEDLLFFYDRHPILSGRTYFLMKKDVFPSKDNNINGEKWIFKTKYSTLFDTWSKLMPRLVNNNLIYDSKHMDIIDGIEIQSHNKKYGLIKIWMSQHTNHAIVRQRMHLDMKLIKIVPNNIHHHQ